MFYLALAIGLFVGSIIGIIAISLCIMAKKGNDRPVNYWLRRP